MTVKKPALGTPENPALGLADLKEWDCPATSNAEPADRGHRYQGFFHDDPRDVYRVFCERCGHSVAYLNREPDA